MTRTPTRACATCRKHKPEQEFQLSATRWVASCDACRLALRHQIAETIAATAKDVVMMKTIQKLNRMFVVRDLCSAPARDRSGEKVPARTLQQQGLYDGAELQPYEGRPGAMDAFHLPSLHMGTRTWRRA